MIETDARLSADGLYRYELERRWGPGAPVVWIMLNPSTADATNDDPTIRRCRSFTERWDRSALVVVNLYGLRGTRPQHLLDHPDPVGPDNQATINRWLEEPGALLVAAWGAHAKRTADAGMPNMAAEVAGQVWRAGRVLWCLGETKDGDPRHPLYVRGDEKLRVWA